MIKIPRAQPAQKIPSSNRLVSELFNYSIVHVVVAESKELIWMKFGTKKNPLKCIFDIMQINILSKFSQWSFKVKVIWPWFCSCSVVWAAGSQAKIQPSQKVNVPSHHHLMQQWRGQWLQAPKQPRHKSACNQVNGRKQNYCTSCAYTAQLCVCGEAELHVTADEHQPHQPLTWPCC